MALRVYTYKTMHNVLFYVSLPCCQSVNIILDFRSVHEKVDDISQYSSMLDYLQQVVPPMALPELAEPPLPALPEPKFNV